MFSIVVHSPVGKTGNESDVASQAFLNTIQTSTSDGLSSICSDQNIIPHSSAAHTDGLFEFGASALPAQTSSGNTVSTDVTNTINKSLFSFGNINNRRKLYLTEAKSPLGSALNSLNDNFEFPLDNNSQQHKVNEVDESASSSQKNNSEIVHRI